MYLKFFSFRNGKGLVVPWAIFNLCVYTDCICCTLKGHGLIEPKPTWVTQRQDQYLATGTQPGVIPTNHLDLNAGSRSVVPASNITIVTLCYQLGVQ